MKFVLHSKLESLKELGDNELFETFVREQRSEYFFREILNRYKQRVYWQVRRILIQHDDADEVCQLVFIKLWKNADAFKFNSALSSFIYRIAYNETMTFLKQKKRFSSLDELLDAEGNVEGMTEDGLVLDGDKIAAQLQNALLTLPEKQRMVFNYKYFDDLQYNEISEITGTSVGALKSNYHFAVEKIKKYLDPD